MYTTRHIAQRFGISPATVKNYAVEFAAFLSPTATPEPGTRRSFTEADVTVFALICQRKTEGATYEHIHAALAAGQRIDTPAAPQQLALAEQVAHLRAELAAARTERDEARGEIKALKDMLRELLDRLQG